MRQDQKQSVITILLLANLVVMGFYSINIFHEVSRLQGDMMDIDHELEWRLKDMEEGIVRRVTESIETSNSLISRLEYNLERYDASKEEAIYKINLVLKESNKDCQIKWLYHSKDLVGESYLTAGDHLSYQGEVAMPIDHDYTISLVQVTADGERMLNQNPIALELKTQYLDQRIRHNESSGSSGYKKFARESLFEMNILDDANYGLEKLELLIMKDDELIASREVTEEIFMGEDPERLRKELYSSDRYEADSTEQASGYSQVSSMTSSENNEAVEVFKKIYLLHYFQGRYADYEGLRDDNIGIKYRFTFKDGYVYED